MCSFMQFTNKTVAYFARFKKILCDLRTSCAILENLTRFKKNLGHISILDYFILSYAYTTVCVAIYLWSKRKVHRTAFVAISP